MKLEKQRLKGFTGIKRGLGLDEIEIDFSGITGLTALEGANGAGKSTVLENLHPYNQLASREGALYQHVCDRKAEKELSFFYADHHYKTLLKIDCESERSEGFIWRDGKSEVKGKISEYARYWKTSMGSPELFFASAFCAQGSKKLSEMRTGELKTLFGEFLRLGRYQKWEDTAKQCGNILNGKAGQIETRIKTLSEQVAGKDETTEKYMSLGRSVEFLKDDQHILKESLVEKRLIVNDLNKAISNNKVWIARKADIETSIAKLTNDRDTEKSVAEAEIESLKGKWRELAEELKKHNAILQDKEAIEGAAAKERELTEKIEQLSQEIEGINERVNLGQKAVHELETEIQGRKNILQNLMKEIIDPAKDAVLVSLRSRAAHLKGKMLDLDRKDKDCQSVTCSFIKGALDAAGLLPVVEEDIADREAAIQAGNENSKGAYTLIDGDLKEQTEMLKGARVVLQTGNQALEEKRKALATLRYDVVKIKELAAKASIVQVAEQRKADIEKQQAEITEQGKTKREVINKRVADFDLEIDAKKVEAEECERSIDHDAESRLKALAAEIEKVETVDLPQVERDIQESREKLATLKAELEKIQEAEKELEQVRKEKDRLAGDVSHWRYLQTACGKNGLQALEIDGTAPLITGYANNLLSQAFAPLSSVKLVTQDENGKECLDIMVPTEDGSEILLDNLSGGQKVWNLMALRLAMTLLSKEKSGLAFMTAFADELDGALDPENALNFVGMYRSFMQIGGFSDFLFISHKPSCRGMADNILKFEHGKVPYWA